MNPTYDSLSTINFECALTFAYDVVAADGCIFIQPGGQCQACAGGTISTGETNLQVDSLCKSVGARDGSLMLATAPELRSTIFDINQVNPIFLAACPGSQPVTTVKVPLSTTMQPVTTTPTPRAVEGGIFPQKVNAFSY